MQTVMDVVNRLIELYEFKLEHFTTAQDGGEEDGRGKDAKDAKASAKRKAKAMKSKIKATKKKAKKKKTRRRQGGKRTGRASLRRALFTEIDEDDNGVIDKEEFKAAIKALGYDPNMLTVLRKAKAKKISRKMKKILKKVGRTVADKITEEALAAGKTKTAARRQGKVAGRAAVKFAKSLIKKQPHARIDWGKLFVVGRKAAAKKESEDKKAIVLEIRAMVSHHNSAKFRSKKHRESAALKMLKAVGGMVARHQGKEAVKGAVKFAKSLIKQGYKGKTIKGKAPKKESKDKKAIVLEIRAMVSNHNSAKFKSKEHRESAAQKMLDAVGGMVAYQITEEALAAGRSKKLAHHQGKEAGKDAVKFAAGLIKKQPQPTGDKGNIKGKAPKVSHQNSAKFQIESSDEESTVFESESDLNETSADDASDDSSIYLNDTEPEPVLMKKDSFFVNEESEDDIEGSDASTWFGSGDDGTEEEE